MVQCCTRATILIQGQLYRYSYRQISVTIHRHIDVSNTALVFSVGGTLSSNVIPDFKCHSEFLNCCNSTTTNINKNIDKFRCIPFGQNCMCFYSAHWAFLLNSEVTCKKQYNIILQECCHRHVFPISLGCIIWLVGFICQRFVYSQCFSASRWNWILYCLWKL